jgi:GT2 family glycosyltransferase
VIVNFNTVDYLRECIVSIYLHTKTTPEIIVVDNASKDGSVEMVRNEFPQVILIASEQNLGFGLGNNLGVEKATHPYVMLFNSDAVLLSDTAKTLCDFMEKNPTVSCVGPRVLLPKTLQLQPKTFGFAPNAKRVIMQSLGLNRLFPQSEFFAGVDGDFRWGLEMHVGWISGVCMLMRKEDFQRVNGFDPRFFMYCEDIELCMKLNKFGDIVLLDTADIIHYGGASSKTIPSKVRNSVWQQRHLLIIVKDYFGSTQAFFARLIMLFGMLLRLVVALMLSYKKGIKQNEPLHSAWARFVELLGFNAIAKVK